VEPWGVQLRTGERLHADTVLWAAGVAGATLLRTLSPSVELDRQGRVMVLEDCSVPGFGETFVVGDAACMFGPLGDALPSVGSAAMQMGRYVGQQIAHEVADPRPSARPAFCYVDPGVVVTLGRGDAVAVSGRKLLTGRRAWWQLVPHLWRLAAFGGRSRAFSDWALAYLRYRRGARIILSERAGSSTADHAYQQGVFGALEEDSQVRAALGRR
jgi:NADH dehydrogenase